MPKPTRVGADLTAVPGDVHTDNKTGHVYDVILDVQRILHPDSIRSCLDRNPAVCDIYLQSEKESARCYDVAKRLHPTKHVYCDNTNRPDPILFRRRPRS